jgi:NAD(P)-dependent dehydrogenase (short-subunit alcohol dehydrogenase family)
MSTQKVWLITGAARGLGFEIAKTVLAAGDKVVATVRSNAEKLAAELNNENLHVLTLDVVNEAQTKEAVAEALATFGKIDILLNNAGFGLLSGVEEGSDEQVRKMFDTNVFGSLNMIRSVAPHLRQQRSGHIINISSIGGLVASAGWGLYNSTKFAVEGFTEALYKELKPLGVHVTVIEPGYFRTNFLDGSSLNQSENIIADYADTVGKTRLHAAEVNHKQPGDPHKLALALIKLVAAENPPMRLPMGQDTLAAYKSKTEAFQKEIQEWHDTIVSTDH